MYIPLFSYISLYLSYTQHVHPIYIYISIPYIRHMIHASRLTQRPPPVVLRGREVAGHEHLRVAQAAAVLPHQLSEGSIALLHHGRHPMAKTSTYYNHLYIPSHIHR